MREALARSDNDFVLSESARKAPRHGPLLAALVAIFGFAFRLAAYPSRLLGGLVFGLTIAILVNALMLQHSRHPAPLFHKTVTLVAPDDDAQAPAQTAAAKPQLPSAALAAPATARAPALQEHDAIAQLLSEEPTAPTKATAGKPHDDEADEHVLTPNRHMREASHPTKPAPDPIGNLLKEEASPPTAEDGKTILGVQQALLKLGYVLHPDGQMGGVTRRALEQYESDRGLPIETGLSPKLLHRLSAEAGMPIK